MKNRVLCHATILWMTVWTDPARGQVGLSAGVYWQDFDTLTAGGAAGWLDNATVPGWYAAKSAAPHTMTNYTASAGTHTTGGLYSFGDAGATDRALGSLASGGPGRLAYGVRFRNDTGLAQTGFAVSCTGEQWRAGGPAAQRLLFSYQVGADLTNADAANDLSWTPCAELDFNSPNTNATQALPGNDPTNQMVFDAVSLPGVVVPPGRELFLRWLDADDAGYDDALAIDNLRVAFDAVDPNAFALPTNAAFSLMTYNTHGNQVENWSTNAYQVRAIGRQLIYLHPDILVLNEIPETNTHQMDNWVTAFLPGYTLATNSIGDGSIRNVIASRFPVVRSGSWLHGTDLAPYGCSNTVFKRDLFEAEIAVPGFPQGLSVFAVHLKSGQDTAASAERAAEAAAVSNFFVTVYPPGNGLRPFIVGGDLNEDVVRPPASHPGSVQRLIAPLTGLRLITPLNPVTQEELTFSIQSAGLTRRYDYILPCALLASNIAGRQVFRTDLLNPPPAPLWTNDDRIASDHLPVIVVFGNPYDKPFRLISVTRSNRDLALSWESVPGGVYRVETSRDMKGWSNLGDARVATGASCGYSFETTLDPQFIRVKRGP